MNVAVLANLKKNAPVHPLISDHAWDELDSETTVHAIISALESAGHHAIFLEGNLSLVEKLPALKPDLCFNICEGHWGDSRESHIPSILEMLRIPYTGSRVQTNAISLDKTLTKRIKKRGRDFERAIDGGYLDLLSKAYNDFFFHYDETPLLVVNASDIDLAAPEDAEALVQVIRRHRKGMQHYVPLGTRSLALNRMRSPWNRSRSGICQVSRIKRGCQGSAIHPSGLRTMTNRSGPC